MKKIIFIILILMISSAVHSIEYFGFRYNFPYFRYVADQSFGGSVSVYGNGDLDKMFEISAELNAYIKTKVEQNKLKNKPIVYDICGFEYKRDRWLLEIYEGENAYHVSINTINCTNFYYFLTREDLFHVVDYIASPDFKPIYMRNKPNGRLNLKEGLSNYVQTPTYEVYSLGNINIRYIDGGFQVLNKDEKLNLVLDAPFAKPIKFHNRILIIDNDHLFVIEKGVLTKKEDMRGILNGEGLEYNYIKYNIYLDKVDFCSSIDGEVLFSYYYKENRLDTL